MRFRNNSTFVSTERTKGFIYDFNYNGFIINSGAFHTFFSYKLNGFDYGYEVCYRNKTLDIEYIKYYIT